MDPFSNVPDNTLVGENASHEQNKVGKDHTQHCGNDTRDERRARMLARVYGYLLARATEIEAVERNSLPTGTVHEIGAMDQSDDVPIE